MAGAPVSWTVDIIGVGFACLCLWDEAGAFFAAEGDQSTVRMKDGEIAFKLVDEIKLHFGELGIVGRKALDGILVVYTSGQHKSWRGKRADC